VHTNLYSLSSVLRKCIPICTLCLPCATHPIPALFPQRCVHANSFSSSSACKLIPSICLQRASAHQEKKNLRSERPDTLDAQDTLDATCLTRTQFVMAPCIRTQLATAPCVGRSSPRHLPTGWSVSGHFPSGRSHVRAFSFWTQPCQRIFLLDAAVSAHFLLDADVSGHFPSGRSRVRANGVQTTRVMAPRSRWLSRHGTLQQILSSYSQTRSGFQA